MPPVTVSPVIWFLGDVHESVRHVHEALDSAQQLPHALIFLGDIEAQRPFHLDIAEFQARGVTVFWIRGNHDTDQPHLWHNLLGAMAHNIDGKVTEIGGLRVAGFDGIFRGSVWNPKKCPDQFFATYEAFATDLHQKQGLPRRLEKLALKPNDPVPEHIAQLMDDTMNNALRVHHSTIFPARYQEMAAQRADLLVTHEGPSAHPFGFAEIDALIRDMGVRWHFHGHLHDNLPYPEESGVRRSHGVGLRGITALDTGSGMVSVVVAGEEDQIHLLSYQRHLKEVT